MNKLVDLARAGVTMLVKDDPDATIGRAPTAATSPVASPAVPSEQAAQSKRPRKRSTQDVIRDAIEVLESGLKQDDDRRAQQRPSIPPMSQQERSEVSSALQFLKKSGDTNVSVKGVIKDSEGRILMLRDAHSKYWDLPGGHVIDGEGIDVALKREIFEETGLDVLRARPTETRMLDLGGTVRPVLFFEVECDLDRDPPRCSQEHIGYQWAGVEDLQGLQLGVFGDILLPPEVTMEHKGSVLIPGADTQDQPVLGSPSVWKDGAGAGGDGGGAAPDVMVGSDVHTEAIGSPKERKTCPGCMDKDCGKEHREERVALKSLTTRREFAKMAKYLSKVSSGKAMLDTTDPAEYRWIQKSTGGGWKFKRALIDPASKDLFIINKAKKDGRFIIAGYASPVVVDQEGHRISHKVLAEDLPRFLGQDGRYANLNVFHSNATVGTILPEYTSPDGTYYKTEVDDVGLFVVAEVRTDPDAPAMIQGVIKEIERKKLKSFSISGTADNPTFVCEEERCFFDIGDLDLIEITLCSEGVNQDANFEVVNK